MAKNRLVRDSFKRGITEIPDQIDRKTAQMEFSTSSGTSSSSKLLEALNRLALSIACVQTLISCSEAAQ
jgi:hypothetical protein